jgi:26S proteasome regulatory subunit N5
MEELKLKFYHLMIRYYGFYNNYLEMTRCYKAVYEMESVQADPSRWVEVSNLAGCACWAVITLAS